MALALAVALGRRHPLVLLLLGFYLPAERQRIRRVSYPETVRSTLIRGGAEPAQPGEDVSTAWIRLTSSDC